MSEPVIRLGSPADTPVLAPLKWEWARHGQTPAPGELGAFAETLAAWMTEHRDDVRCSIALLDGQAIGMAWLALYDRVPNPGDEKRRSGDVQSMFVLPAHRRRGIGRELVRLLLQEADALGVRRVSTHSTPKAVPFYESAGFARSDLWLQRGE